jgi:aryl-alcohol dehydrogenase-like predicted oxidoreductase
VLATKAAGSLGPGPFESGTSRKALIQAIDASLKRLDTDYIDLYQMHRYDQNTPLEETLSTLNDLVRQGKTRYVGVSNWTASQIADAARVIEAHNWEPLISLQPQYSILSRDIEVEIVPTCLKFGLGIIPWSPLAGGVLTGKYRPGEEPPAGTRLSVQPNRRALVDRTGDIVSLVVDEAKKLGATPVGLSLAWNLSKPGVVSPIIGPKSVQQLDENLAALELTLPPETIEMIDAASEPALGYPHNFGRQLNTPPARN